jgi:hypothetical protein
MRREGGRGGGASCMWSGGRVRPFNNNSEVIHV